MGISKFPQTGDALSLVSRVSFSGVSSQIFDNVFSGTHHTYMIAIDDLTAVTATDDLHFQWRKAGATQTSGYNYAVLKTVYNATTVSSLNGNAASQILLSEDISNSLYGTSAVLWVQGAGNSIVKWADIKGHVTNKQVGSFYSVNGYCNISEPTGFLLKSSSSNISGTVSIYGYGA